MNTLIFKCRCSHIGKIMSTSRNITEANKTYLQQWAKEKMYNRKYEFYSKYTDKGNVMEDTAIDNISEYLKLGILIKNEEKFENDYLTGTPDLIIKEKDLIIDIKNSWSPFTFPIFDNTLENKDYYYQGQGYMALTGINHYKVAYILSDTPEHLIRKEAQIYASNSGYGFLDEDLIDKYTRKMTYADIPEELKVKIFDFEKDENVIAEIYQKIEKCREFLHKLPIKK